MNAPTPEGAVHPITNTSPNIRAWACVARRTNWAVTTLNHAPQPFVNHLATTVTELSTTHSVLRHIIALANNSATLSNEELRNQLAALTEALTEACAR
jgi:hypothetical protein